jgi:hypothetical protein
MSSSPSTHGANGKDANGRFTRGNRCGRGNPLAGRAAKVRAVLLEELSPDDARAIARKLIEQARAGDLASAKEIFDRTVGRPVQSELAERLERLEQQLLKGAK